MMSDDLLIPACISIFKFFLRLVEIQCLLFSILSIGLFLINWELF